jgi:hypothetical protein
MQREALQGKAGQWVVAERKAKEVDPAHMQHTAHAPARSLLESDEAGGCVINGWVITWHCAMHRWYLAACEHTLSRHARSLHLTHATRQHT